MASLPSGTVPFLFADSEGSTARWEHHRDQVCHPCPIRSTREEAVQPLLSCPVVDTWLICPR